MTGERFVLSLNTVRGETPRVCCFNEGGAQMWSFFNHFWSWQTRKGSSQRFLERFHASTENPFKTSTRKKSNNLGFINLDLAWSTVPLLTDLQQTHPAVQSTSTSSLKLGCFIVSTRPMLANYSTRLLNLLTLLSIVKQLWSCRRWIICFKPLITHCV